MGFFHINWGFLRVIFVFLVCFLCIEKTSKIQLEIQKLQKKTQITIEFFGFLILIGVFDNNIYISSSIFGVLYVHIKRFFHL